MSRLTISGSSIAVETPFDRDFVDSLKAIVPYSDRKWDTKQKLWLISDAYGQAIANLIHGHFGETVTVPTVTASATPTMKIVQLIYLGRTKERGPNVYTATGYSDGTSSLYAGGISSTTTGAVDLASKIETLMLQAPSC
jgi:hypothetical protein